jgi:hypothetical protein
MADLTQIINMGAPENVLNAWYESRDRQRSRLGLSEIGHPCKRYLWYRHHGYQGPAIDGQTLRLFSLGNVIEAHLIDDLRSAGYQILGMQDPVKLSYGDCHLFGHCDGIISGLVESDRPHLLEIKTANEKSFKLLKKANSYEKWSPKYKGQIHAYMLGLSLARALVLVYDKNTSEIYSERIRFDRQYIIELMGDVFSVTPFS